MFIYLVLLKHFLKEMVLSPHTILQYEYANFPFLELQIQRNMLIIFLYNYYYYNYYYYYLKKPNNPFPPFLNILVLRILSAFDPFSKISINDSIISLKDEPTATGFSE